MVTPEQVLQFVAQFIQSVGVDPTTCWNEEKKAYYVTKGSARIEVFISNHPMKDGSIRHYLRIFSGMMKVPHANRERFYRRLLELNDQSLGVKLTVMPNAQPDNDWVYATFERDIKGIDYNETATCIADLGYWADMFDDQLKNEFGGGGGGGGFSPGPA
ncbi:MAG: YbjN domain-containing protein [Bacteroidota bacterium]